VKQFFSSPNTPSWSQQETLYLDYLFRGGAVGCGTAGVIAIFH
jgi:hypothetical protein